MPGSFTLNFLVKKITAEQKQQRRGGWVEVSTRSNDEQASLAIPSSDAERWILVDSKRICKEVASRTKISEADGMNLEFSEWQFALASPYYPRVIEQLTEYNAELTKRNSTGWTLFHMAFLNINPLVAVIGLLKRVSKNPLLFTRVVESLSDYKTALVYVTADCKNIFDTDMFETFVLQSKWFIDWSGVEEIPFVLAQDQKPRPPITEAEYNELVGMIKSGQAISVKKYSSVNVVHELGRFFSFKKMHELITQYGKEHFIHLASKESSERFNFLHHFMLSFKYRHMQNQHYYFDKLEGALRVIVSIFGSFQIAEMLTVCCRQRIGEDAFVELTPIEMALPESIMISDSFVRLLRGLVSGDEAVDLIDPMKFEGQPCEENAKILYAKLIRDSGKGQNRGESLTNGATTFKIPAKQSLGASTVADNSDFAEAAGDPSSAVL
jgi:hypothetical protein